MTTSASAWNLVPLRAHITRNFADKEEILRLVRSIDRSSRIFTYHMRSARDALKLVTPSGTRTFQDEMLLAILGASDRQNDFESAKIVNEAHLIGCLHTVRGMLDIFAQLVNATVLSPRLSRGSCEIAKVAKRLPSCALRVRLDDLLSSYWCIYIFAFINTTKHRQLVEHMTTVSFADDRSGIKIGAFKYSDKDYPEYWDTEVLKGAVEVSNGVVNCGRLLNSHLGL